MLNKVVWFSVFISGIVLYSWIAYALIKYSLGD